MSIDKLSAKSLKQLYASSGNHCALTHCEQVIVDQFGTLSASVMKLPQEPTNAEITTKEQAPIQWVRCHDLLLVCPDCSERIAKEPQSFPFVTLRKIKQEHEKGHARACLRSDARIAQRLLQLVEADHDSRTFVIDPKGNVTLAPALHIPPPVSLPQQTIGDDRLASNYIAYLILRYNEFAAKGRDPSGQFNPKTISQNLRSRYKSHWKDMPRVRFPHVCRYLKHRIDGTHIAKSNARKGLSSYRSYDAFLRKPQKR